jgi:GPH family glycoside/pentoside/hexuronide:cation symporter
MANTASRTPPPVLTNGVKVLYGIGGVAYAVKNTQLGLLLLFYNQLIGLPAQLASLALSISLVIDAVWDPMVGQVSDNFRSRLGRRHPFMYAAALPFALGWVLLFNPPKGWSHAALFCWLLGLIVLCRMAIALFEVPTTALTPELAPDYHARTDLFSYRYVFGALGGVGGAVLGYAVFLRSRPGAPMGQLNEAGYGPYAVAIAALMGASMLIAAAGTHRWIPALYKPPKRPFSLVQMVREILATLVNRNFGAMIVAGVFSGLAGGIGTGLGIYFNTYFWELPSSSLLVLVLEGLISVPVAALLAPTLSRRLGKKGGTVALMCGTLVLSVTPISLRLMGLMPSNGTPLLLGALFVCTLAANACTGGALILSTSMISDVSEESELKTGRRSEGLLMSASSVLQKILGGVAAIVPGLLLAFVHFPQKARPGHVPAEVLRHLALLYLPITALMTALAIVCVSRYRINRQAHESNLATLRDADGMVAVEQITP